MKKLNRDEILYYALKYNGNYQKMIQAIIKKESIDYDYLNWMKPKVGNFLTIKDDDYPESLRIIRNQPLIIFYKGNLDLLKNPKSVALVGTNKRIKSVKSIEKIKSYVESFAEIDIIPVSSLETGTGVGCLTQIFSSYANEPIPSIAVCCGGINYSNGLPTFINDQLEETSLIISEYPLDTKPDEMTKIKAKRLVSGLAEKILFLETDIGYNFFDKEYSFKHNKVIMADIDTNDLTKNSLLEEAIPVSKAEDILNLFALDEQELDGISYDEIIDYL